MLYIFLRAYSRKKKLQEQTRHADAHRLDMKNFINRPIPRLARYQLLLDNLLTKTPPNHDDRIAIPEVIETIKSVARDADRWVASAKSKVEIWRYNSSLAFKSGESYVSNRVNCSR
jgi:RHO1 GDP-GTP exchange protein 1/2